MVDRSPFERDFLLGTRLDYLHIIFLLQSLLLRHLNETEDALLETSQEILSLVVEALMLKDRLVNAGSGIDWKVSLHHYTMRAKAKRVQVAHYGLPAAGIISLALVRKAGIAPAGNDESAVKTEMLRNLNILVAHIEVGAIVQIGEPNFALFSRAARTIKRILDNLASGGGSRFTRRGAPPFLMPETPATAGDDWSLWLNSDPWDFEIDFWRELAEHPSLSGSNTALIP